MKRIALIVCILMLGCSAVWAQTYRIDWYCISSGGGEVAGGSYKLNGTIGQPAAGYVETASLKHWIGFWVGEGGEEPTVCEHIYQAKEQEDGTLVSISGKIAISGPSDFADFFYIEEEDRFSGIRVSAPTAAISGLARGSVVNVVGTLGTTTAGERQIEGPMVIVASSATVPDPLGMTNKAIGGMDFGVPPLGQYGVTEGVGLNNVGLLVKTWGVVLSVDGNRVLVDDGSGAPVWVDCSVLSTMPAQDDTISVIGISSLYKPGLERLRYLLARPGDVTWH